MDIWFAIACVSMVAWGYLVLFHGRFWRAAERLAPAPAPDRWPAVVAVVPARNEAATIAATLDSLRAQDYAGILTVVLIDDGSDDGTGDIGRARAQVPGRVRTDVVNGAPLEPGWTGKLWAMHQGVAAGFAAERDAEFILFTDADIVHPPDLVTTLVAKAQAEWRDLVSLMVKLHCAGPWEKLLIPAFVFFFQKLYPFPLVNDPKSRVAGAAGGCVLVRRAALDTIGGVAAIRGALIDDCTLASAIKAKGGNLWLGLAEHSRSLRVYDSLGEIWAMVARSAYTQLKYSPLLLAGTLFGMLLLYAVPLFTVLAWPVHHSTPAAAAGLIALALSFAAYWPTLSYYGEPPSATAALPVAAMFYLLMTLDSARRHYAGRGGQWKGRYAPASPRGSPGEGSG